jgi:uncharacterized membrane protein
LNNATRLGHALFAIGMFAFAVLCYVWASPILGLESLPAWLPEQLLWTYLVAAILGLAAITLFAKAFARAAATVLAAMLTLWVLFFHVPGLLTQLHSGNEWTSAFETLALSAAAWILAAALSRAAHGADRWDNALQRLATFGRYAFGVSLPVFGVLHFIYSGYVSSVIPTWIPYPLFWAYFTGLAHIAAGLAILSGVMARWAATMLGIMFGSWVLILHIPRVIAHPHTQAEWTSLFVATALCGGAWLVAGYLSKPAVRA